MSRPPDVIGPPDVIPGAMRVIRPIANLDRDGAWVGIARGTGITGCVWAISRVTASVWVTAWRLFVLLEIPNRDRYGSLNSPAL
jgi:hypothetical protein